MAAFPQWNKQSFQAVLMASEKKNDQRTINTEQIKLRDRILITTRISLLGMLKPLSHRKWKFPGLSFPMED